MRAVLQTRGYAYVWQRSTSFSADKSSSPWLFPASIQRFSIRSRLTTAVPSSSRGWLLGPAANRRAMARLLTPGMQKALIVHLFGQRGGKGTCPSLRDALQLPGNRRGCPGTEGLWFCQTSGVQNGVAPCAPYSPLAPVQQSGVA